MERIIINEIDNTSNIEALSTYDVVYVPGFSMQGSDDSLYRNPTLITSKYQFLKTFGGSSETGSQIVPTFSARQMYPVASESKKGFPTYAIPNYKPVVVDTTSPLNLSTFTDMESIEDYYVHVEVVAEEGAEDWVKNPDVNYFELEGNDQTGYTMRYSTLPLEAGHTYVETYGEQGLNDVYMSDVDPFYEGWYELSVQDYVQTIDSQISIVPGTTTIKSYYLPAESSPAMYEMNEPDPGYRYALYLLSLGIPIYYEQMNSVGFDEIDLTSDWASALVQYGEYIEVEGATRQVIKPADNGWYYKDGEQFIRASENTSKASITYTNAEDVGTDVWYVGSDISIKSLYEGLEKRFMTGTDEPDYSFDSIGDYSVKYISTGGYPTFEYGLVGEDGKVVSGLAEAMMALAHKRGDAVALIDHTNNPYRSIYESEELSVIFKAREDFANVNEVIASHGAMFTPWYSCTHSVIAGETGAQYPNAFMPASLAFLSALATQLRNYNPWLAVSGVTRGKIPYFGALHTIKPLTNNVADSYQSVPSDEVSEYALISINPITYIRQYGYCIWGNRTLRNNKTGTKATSFLNIRNLVSDIKKRLYEASQQLLFEQNTELLWIDFKQLVTPLLDTMVSSNILSDYRMTKYNVDPVSGEAVPAYKVLANIMIRPINSVEVFDLTVQLENNEIAVAETE